MKIALIGRYGEGEIVSGPERVARELYSEMKTRNLQVVFIEYFFSGYCNASWINKVIGRKILNNDQMIRLGIFPFIQMLFREKFDIIHVINHQRFILFLFFIKPFTSWKLVTTFHGLLKQEIPQNKLWKKRYFIDLLTEKFLVKKSKLLIFPSKLLFETINKYFKISQKKYQIIPNGVSKIFRNRATSFPHFENSIKLIFYSGFSDAINRGLDKLLDLMNSLKFEVELFVIGDKVEVKPEKNIQIYFTDSMSHAELINFVSDKHFIIKSSVFDSFSILIAECMTLGLIPIISENIGIKDVIKHGENGFVYNSSSLNNLSKLMNEIYHGKYDLNLISANAQETSKKLNWEKISKEYISTYKSIL